MQKLVAPGALLIDTERLADFRLSGGEELPQLGQIDGVFPVVVLRVSLDVSGLLHE